MIIYDLICKNSHRFEGWFKNADDYKHQLANHMLSCPLCSNTSVQKVPSATNIITRRNKDPNRPQPIDDIAFLSQLRQYIDQNFEEVGDNFSEEARKIHYGEVETRNIKGNAQLDEVKQLHEEGINIIPLPTDPVDKNKLN